MEFGLSKSQALLRDSIVRHLDAEVPLSRVRSVAEGQPPYDRDIHAGLGEQGIAGLLVEARYGGSGLGLFEAAVAAQAQGQRVTPVSFHSAFVLAPLLLRAAASEEQKEAWLPRVASGQAVLAPLVWPGERDAGEALSGSVSQVADAPLADAFLLALEEAFYLVPRDAAGVEVTPQPTFDATRCLGQLRLEKLELEPGWRLPGGVEGWNGGLDAARIVLAADCLGAAQQAIQMAVEYAMQREQFGRAIGTFQAVKHVCAEMIAAVEPLQSLLWYTAFAWDEGRDEVAWLAPLLKAQTAEAATETLTQATQIFGGMGYTWECDMHLFFKRVGYDRQLCGGPSVLRQEAAARQFGVISDAAGLAQSRASSSVDP